MTSSVSKLDAAEIQALKAPIRWRLLDSRDSGSCGKGGEGGLLNVSLAAEIELLCWLFAQVTKSRGGIDAKFIHFTFDGWVKHHKVIPQGQ